MIIQNAIKILETKEFLVSSFGHDFQGHTFKDGTSIYIDGGRQYFRMGGDVLRTPKGKWQNWSLTDKSKFSTIVNRMLWGTRGKDGKSPLKYVLLKDCDVNHLRSILMSEHQIKGTIYETVIKTILQGK